MTRFTKKRDPHPFAAGWRPETEGTGAKTAAAAAATRGGEVEGAILWNNCDLFLDSWVCVLCVES
jgi:hypothetical protein